jgi:hypothetical protein
MAQMCASYSDLQGWFTSFRIAILIANATITLLGFLQYHFSLPFGCKTCQGDVAPLRIFSAARIEQLLNVLLIC